MANKKKEPVKSKPKVLQQAPASNRLYILILIIYTFFIYGNSIRNDYALDDKVVMVKNEFVKKGVAGIKDILTKDTFAGFFTEENLVAGGRYRPLSLVTFAFEKQIFGQNPGVSHFINVLLYALTGILIFLLLKQLLLDSRMRYSNLVHLPFITALLFLSLPVHTEAVANIKGRDEILSMLFSILSAHQFLKYSDEGKKMKDILLGSLCLFFGLLSKENAITFLVVIPLMIWFFRKVTLKEYVTMAASIVLVSGIFLLIRQWVTGSSISENVTELMNNPFVGMTLAEKYATILFTFLKYLLLLTFPVTLSHDYYPYQIAIHYFSSFGTIASIIICSGALIIALVQLRKKTLLSFSILYFAVTFSVVSNLFFQVGTFMSERFLYMPSLGFCLILAYLISLIPFYRFNTFPFSRIDISSTDLTHNFFRSRTIQFVLLIIIGANSLRTIFRNPAWENDFVLYSTDVINSPNSAMVHSGLGSQYWHKAEKSKNPIEKEKLIKQAYNEYMIAIKIYPKFDNVYYDIGMIHADGNNLDSAEWAFRKAANINPENIDAQNNIGYCLMQTGKIDSAMNIYRSLIKKDSTRWRPYVNMGACYLNKHDYEKAAFFYQKAFVLNPKNESIINTLDEINAMRQQYPTLQ